MPHKKKKINAGDKINVYLPLDIDQHILDFLNKEGTPTSQKIVKALSYYVHYSNIADELKKEISQYLDEYFIDKRHVATFGDGDKDNKEVEDTVKRLLTNSIKKVKNL